MTHKQMIIAYMKQHGQITAIDAERMGCHRLSARILDLRQEGHNIVTNMEPNATVGMHAVYVFGSTEKG